MTLALTGMVSLALALVAVVVSIGAFAVEGLIRSAGREAEAAAKAAAEERYDRLASRAALVAYGAVLATALALTFGCALLVYCFLTGDVSIEYVVRQHSDSSSPLAPLYHLAGLWGGREGSLLFWAWLIGAFGAIVALRTIKRRDRLDNKALLVIQLVMLAFVVVLLFSPDNMPFLPLDSRYLDAQGQLKSFEQLLQESASLTQGELEPSLVLGMNTLLEHWAMAIHPPTLFVGYAGLTVPFAYAVAALIVNDPSKEWVERSRRYALISWVLLGIGIGLGAIWAYVVLGWGGYWGWDPVENASLLSWLLAVALVHSFTVYRQRGAFKRWSVMCACLTFAFVIVGTFITRSGIVQNSVHAFEGDQVSLVLFGGLILASTLAGVIGLLIRRRSFGTADGSEEIGESLMSKGAAYYFNNVVLVMSAFLILYLTLSSALPGWLPYGGQALSASTYHAIARPLGILYCLLMAVCPLLGWAKTDGAAFWRRLRVPGICAAVLFAALLVYFLTHLLPSYNATMAAGGTQAQTMLEAGPAPYYFALTLVGFAVAALLFMNALFMLGRTIGTQAKAEAVNPLVALLKALRVRASRFGGFLAHLSVGIILVGLIGSSMYVSTASAYLPFDEASDTVSDDLVIGGYRLVYAGNSIEAQANGIDVIYQVSFDVYEGERYRGRLTPGIQLVQTTQQRKPLAGVLGTPLEDLFVVYNGVSGDDELSLTAFINPFISFVWVGFALLMVGTVIATVGRYGPRAKVGARAPAPGAAGGSAKGAGKGAAIGGAEGVAAGAAEAAPTKAEGAASAKAESVAATKAGSEAEGEGEGER